MLPLKSTALVALLAMVTARPALAAETFIYKLIPGKNEVSYTVNVGETTRRVRAGLSGRIEFDIDDNLSITSRVFDLTLEGPFDYGVHGPFGWAPFAPGDKLADYLDVDFAAATGTATLLTSSDGEPIGPLFANVTADNSQGGNDFFTLGSMQFNTTGLYMYATARSEIGGAFQLWPPIDFIQANPGDPRLGSLSANVQRIPEPSPALLLTVGAALIMLRSRSSGATAGCDNEV